MTTEDRRHGKLLPSPVTPTTTVCFTIQIPNAVQYRAALFGQLNILGQWFTWDHPTDGTLCEDCEEAAQLWRDAIANATFSDDCEMDMSCQDVADCIETNPAVQSAIAEQITNNQSNQTTIYETSVVGAPMNAQQRAATIAQSEDCEPNSLFGSITAIVEQLDRNNRDFLEIVEVGTNARERVSTVIAAIPLFETLPINEAIDYVDKLQSEILENYEAQWTDSLKDEYRCDLFCLVKERDTCELTFQDLVEYYNNRLGTALEPINFFGAVVQYFLLGTWAGSTVVDIMMLTQLSAWQEASSWVGVSLRTLQTVGLLGANDDNPDWEILCEDCAEPELPIVIYEVAGYPSGTILQTGENAVTFTATLGSDGYYRVFFAFTNAAKSARTTTLAPSVTFAPGYQGYYPQGQDVVANGYLVGGVAGAPTEGTCYNAITYTHPVPFTVNMVFSEDC